MKTIYLHLGAQKTGSTSLQKSLYLGRDKLRDHGIEYLGRDNFYFGLFSAFTAHPEKYTGNTRRKLTADQIAAERTATLKKLEAEITGSNCDAIVISSENLNKLDEPGMVALRDFLGQFGNVHAVYYYRFLTSWRASFSQHGARIGQRGPISYEQALGTIYDSPKKIISVFGADNTSLVSFEKSVKTGVCNSFLAVMGKPTIEEIGIKEVMANKGMSANAVEAMYIYNSMHPVGHGSRIKRVVQSLRALDGPKYRIPALTTEELEDYRDKFAEMTRDFGMHLEDPASIPINDSRTVTHVTTEALTELIRDYNKAVTSVRKLKKARRAG